MRNGYCQLFVVVAVLLASMLGSCRGNLDNMDQGQLAAHTAKLYYEQLIQGDVDGFVAGINTPATADEGYRALLRKNTQMFWNQQKREHNGIRSVDIVGAAYDEEAKTANAYLLFVYGDGNTEQVLVPMVRVDSLWLLR